jgi:hypothetical protein
MTPCASCKTDLPCPKCDGSQVGAVVLPCPLGRGHVWLQLVDDAGRGVAGAYGDGSQLDTLKTDSNGLIAWTTVKTGPYRVEVKKAHFPEGWELPASLEQNVVVEQGKTAMARFVARRKAQLKVEIVVGDPAMLIGASLKVKDSRSGAVTALVPKQGVNDLEYVRASDYEITLELGAPHRTTNGAAPARVRLDPNDNHLERLEVKAGLYTHVRFIANCLVTVALWVWNNPNWTGQYTGMDTELEDIEARVGYLRSVLEQARQAIGASPATELKVFMVPECFFLGKTGAYQVENYSRLIRRLQDLVSEAKWKGWIFVFGTVNGVFQDSTGAMTEMFNCSPIIQGGFVAELKAAENTRLVQKRVYSSELLADSDLAGLRGALITDEVVEARFGPTESEVVLTRLVRELLADAEPTIGPQTIAQVFAANGLQSGDWTVLKSIAKAEILSDGMLTVVRRIREISLPSGVTTFAQAEFCGFIRRTGSPMLDPKQSGLDKIVKVLIGQASGTTRLGTWLMKPIGERTTTVKLAKTNFDLNPSALIRGLEFRQAKISARLLAIANQMDVANDALLRDVWDENENMPALGEEWTINWFPMMKLLLSKYIQSRAGNTGTEPKAIGQSGVEKLDPNDFVFSITRAGGPWSTAVEVPAEEEKRAAMLFIAAEICADHNFVTAKRVADGVRKPAFVDLHLLPSAGMKVNTNYVAARPGGYIFNCDGWAANAIVSDRGGAIVPVRIPGAPDVDGKNPLTPHSEVIRLDGGANFTPITLAPPNRIALTDDVSRIFGYVPNELHVYPSQPLPQ